MDTRNDAMALIAAVAASARSHWNRASLLPMPHIRTPAPEKYEGQRQAFRIGAWAGDGSEPQVTRQRRRKSARIKAKRNRKI